MINLLPSQEKEKLAWEEQWKVILILALFFLFFLFCLSLILFSINIFISTQEEIQEIFLIEQEGLKTTSIQEMEEKLIVSNSLFLEVDSFYQKQIDLTKILEKISQSIVSETFLTDFDFNISSKQGQNNARISLSGFSTSRNALLEFKQNLENQGFGNVDFPASNWLKPSDINFKAFIEI